MISDQVLIQRCLHSDDRHAYNQLVLKHQSVLRQRLRSGDTALADDLAQDTFVQAFKCLAQFKSQAQFSTWLYKIAYNRYLSQWRRRQSSEVTNYEGFEKELVESSGDSTEFSSSHNVQIDVSRAVQQLTVPQRELVHLCFADGMSHSEAADALSMPLGTVKSHLLRARKKLQLHLSKWYGGQGDE